MSDGPDSPELSLILAHMAEAVVALDGGGKIIFINPSTARLFQLEADQVAGRSILETIRNNDLHEIAKSVRETSLPRSDEITILSPEERIFEVQTVPLEISPAETGALLVLHNITRLRRLEEVRKDFVANVSHELRTPLAAIKGFAETLRLGAIEDKEHRDEFIASIEKHAENLTAMVDDLLKLSAIESKQQAPKLEPISLFEIITAIVTSLSKSAKQNNIRLAIQSLDALPEIRADRSQIKQLFTNLIENAIKYNRPGGNVHIAGNVDGNSIVITVADTGIGIPHEDIPRIFERFYRVEKGRSREMGGTGLGLSIVKHIVEAHGGSIRVESEEGKGSIFSVRLPINSDLTQTHNSTLGKILDDIDKHHSKTLKKLTG